jgi:hypothetical protein
LASALAAGAAADDDRVERLGRLTFVAAALDYRLLDRHDRSSWVRMTSLSTVGRNGPARIAQIHQLAAARRG